MVWLRFDNPDGLLIPGSYVKLLLGKQDRPSALVVPRVAVVTDVNGDYVFVVDADATVQKKQVALGPVLNRRVVVKSGLTAGESVIVEGLQKVRPGITVNAVKSTADSDEGNKP